MANLEKLVKAFEALRVFEPNPTTEDTVKLVVDNIAFKLFSWQNIYYSFGGKHH